MLRLFSLSAEPDIHLCRAKRRRDAEHHAGERRIAAVNRTTRQLAGAAVPTGGGRSACPHRAMSIPAMPPMAASNRLSVNNCLMRRARVAPIDSRTEISFWRAVARESSRLATLAHTSSRTSATTVARIRQRLYLTAVGVVGAAAARVDEQMRNGRPPLIARLASDLCRGGGQVGVQPRACLTLEAGFKVPAYLLRREARFEPPGHLHPPVGRIVQPRFVAADLIVEPQRHCQNVMELGCHTLRPGEDRRGHADDGHRHLLTRIVLPRRLGLPRSGTASSDRSAWRLPEPRDRRPRRHRAPDSASDAEQPVIVARCQQGGRRFCTSVDRGRNAGRPAAGEIGQRLVGGPELLETSDTRMLCATLSPFGPGADSP